MPSKPEPKTGSAASASVGKDTGEKIRVSASGSYGKTARENKARGNVSAKIMSKPAVPANPANRKQERIVMPLTLYRIAEEAREFANNKYFPDSLLSLFAFISVAIVFPFYPVFLLVLLAIAVFVLARLHPLIGLMSLLILTLPMYLYQAPLLALLYCIVLSVSLFFGYKHYRTITLAYALVVLPFSFLGYFLEIPVFVIGLLYIGMKRGAIATAIAIIIVPVIMALTGMPIYAPIAYSSAGFNSATSQGLGHVSAYLTGGKPMPSISAFPAALFNSLVTFVHVALYIPTAISLSLTALAYSIEPMVIQLVLWLVVLFAITNYVIKSRSAFKGSQSSLFSFAILAGYFVVSFVLFHTFNLYSIIGFIITPLALLFMELNDVDVVRALDVMKKDFLGSFGEAFEDLTTGARETLNDIGNYDSTKAELREAILQPIEHKEIAGAYKIRPAKGVLLFGPPGTGKTLIMRALANEVRARFFYVKSTSIISPSIGESSAALSKIFNRVKAHTPAILFFDELDGIARRRDEFTGNADPELLPTLLSEMDGFQKIEGVVVVGSTNVPQLIDPGLMRPGRFDRIIYMPLPDKHGRVEIFRHYAKMYPVSSDIDLNRLADETSRFSGADIANVYRETATHIGNEALKSSKALKITTNDLLDVINATKPSTSFQQLEEYEQFRTDFERRLGGEPQAKEGVKLSLSDVAGMDTAKLALKEALEIPVMHPELMQKYDIKPVSGILLYGPPGCGKTMLINAIAGEMSKVHLINVSGADLSKEGYDNAVKKMKENFFRAKENSPSILFIDEIDSLVPSRDTASELGTRLTAEFLREFDEVKKAENVIIVGATNRPDAIDSALIRPGRFDKLIYASPPDVHARLVIFSANLKKSVVDANIDIQKLADATEGYTGADIVNICREAKMHALEGTLSKGTAPDSEPAGAINTQDIMDIIKSTTPSAPAQVTGRYIAFERTHERR